MRFNVSVYIPDRVVREEGISHDEVEEWVQEAVDDKAEALEEDYDADGDDDDEDDPIQPGVDDCLMDLDTDAGIQ